VCEALHSLIAQIGRPIFGAVSRNFQRIPCDFGRNDGVSGAIGALPGWPQGHPPGNDPAKIESAQTARISQSHSNFDPAWMALSGPPRPRSVTLCTD